MRPMIHDGCKVYNDNGDIILEPTNLGWILHHWQDVDRVEATPIYATDAVTRRDHWDAAVIFYLNDGRIYATPFASKDVLLDWLDRPRFRGLPLRWFGYEGVCGGEKYRISYIPKRYTWKRR